MVRWDRHGVVTDLGLLPGHPSICSSGDINDRGDIIGISTNNIDSNHAVLWPANRNNAA
jgi:hypothetical protein